MIQNFRQPVLRSLYLLSLTSLLSGCAMFGAGPKLPSGTDTASPGYKIGAPYQIGGVWYSPAEDYSYDETGIASWYGPGFHLKKTANGEIFDAEELTAAHRTLPMPTLARVTNLDNGRSVVVRINDRGPFAHGRILDLSRKAAEVLEFVGKGTARVRVQVLADESRAIAQAVRGRGGRQITTAPRDGTYSTAEVTPVRATPAVARYAPPQPPAPQPVMHDLAEIGLDLPDVTQEDVKPDTLIYVQAGSFTMAGNAEMLKRKVQPYGPAKVDVAAVNGVTFYRVRIGPMANVAKADAMLAKIAQDGVTNSRIVLD